MVWKSQLWFHDKLGPRLCLGAFHLAFSYIIGPFVTLLSLCPTTGRLEVLLCEKQPG
jgi:hypothetical protein